VKIALSKEEEALCNEVGLDNWVYAKKINAKREKFDGKEGGMDDAIGLKGELAVAKFLGVEPHIVPFSQDKQWRTHDLEYNGYLIDVKSTDRKYGNLLVALGQKKHNVDIYVLCSVHDRIVHILGWISKKTLMHGDANIQENRYGPCYYYPRGSLLPIQELLSLS